jgi:SAM-dependent MidA family methyltransferase
VTTQDRSLTSALHTLLQRAISQAGGWIPFDRFMALALYAPGMGYYANDSRKFGLMPGSGSDFVTAPELSPLFGKALAAQVAQALQASGTREVWEFGAGSGALALQLLDALGTMGVTVDRYTIVDLSGTLRARQQQALAAHAPRVHWASELPEALHGVVVGNEVLDAMPAASWCAPAVCGTSVAWPGTRAGLCLPIHPPICARRWTLKARTIT